MEVLKEKAVRGLIAECAVETFAIVEGFEVIKDRGGGGGFGGEGLAVLEELRFEGGKGAFGKGVVVAVTGGAHALAQAAAGQ